MSTHCHECGAVQSAKPKRDRSGPQHRRFFAIVNAAFHHWPERPPSGFRPRNAEHLRYWLEAQAGHYTVTTTARIQSADPDKVFALMSAFMRHSEDDRLFVDLDGPLLVQKRTKSIDYDAMGSADFSRLKDAVCDIIKAETGMDAERLLRETEKAA